MNEKPEGPYTLWIDYGYEGWKFKDFPTLQAALEAERYYATTWVITKPVQYAVADITPEDAA